MKRILVFAVFALIFGGLNAQTDKGNANIQKTTTELSNKLKLDYQQAKQLLEIQKKHADYAEQLQALKVKDPHKFKIKSQSLENGTNRSIKKILRPEQIITFNQLNASKMSAKEESIQKLRASGASKEEIQKALMKKY